MAPGKRVLVGVYDAVGGPSHSGKDEAGNSFGPTDKGTYVVAYCKKHTSPSLYRKWSSIPWGARLRDWRGALHVYLDGRWQPIHNFTSATRDEITTYHAILYGRWTLPDRWVFNDFGHQTCYFFKDINHNRKLDGKESIHPEFIHTTPVVEAMTDQSVPISAIELGESHGCIHVKPRDIDEMIAKGYLRKGNSMIVHSYIAKAPFGAGSRGRPPFEVHFYPGSKKLVIFGLK